MISKQTLEDAAVQIQSDGQGVYRIEVVRPRDVPGLLLAMADGDHDATRTAGLSSKFLLEICAEREPPLLCLLCENELSAVSVPHAVVMMTALRADVDEQSAIVNGLCYECSENPDLNSAIVTKYRESLIPDLRVLGPIGEAGRA